MDHYNIFHEVLVNLFQEVMDIEEKALITSAFRDISINDMHIIEAIGTEEPRNMSSVAKTLSVTVGTLTIAINGLVKKGYVGRVRSEEDRRVVLISLTDKGQDANAHHRKFHEEMILAFLSGIDEKEEEVLANALGNLKGFFNRYKEEQR